MKNVGLENQTNVYTEDDFKKIQSVLQDYQIKIYSKSKFGDISFAGPARDKVLHLYEHDSQFDVITRMPPFLNVNYYCETCDKGYDHPEYHRCSSKCQNCYKNSPCLADGLQDHYCTDCHHYFKSKECFDNHRRRNQNNQVGNKKQRIESICDRFKRCEMCYIFVDTHRKPAHKCSHFQCPTCKEQVVRNGHQCYIAPLKEIKKKKNDNQITIRYVFFDTESSQDTLIEQDKHGNVFQHKVNCCIAQWTCTNCLSMGKDSECNICREGYYKWFGYDSINQFCQWLFKDGPQDRTICMAHNMKSYDGIFVLNWLHKQSCKPEIIKNGYKLMMIEEGSVRIIDSYNFINTALVNFPKMFGIKELVKGHFPHYFNKTENWNYIGAYPGISYYGADHMKPAARENFLTWYYKETSVDEQTQMCKIFNFREQLVTYCRADVAILTECCLKFRELFIKETTLDPFENSITIASACMKVFRSLFLKKNTIGLIPIGGYNKKEKHSVIAIKWLKWLSYIHQIDIRHARNRGKIKIAGFKVDGLHEKTIFELYGR